MKDGELEAQAETLLANVWLARGHVREAHDAASRALAVPPARQTVLSRLEARLAGLMASARLGSAPDAPARADAIAKEAGKLGFASIELEARLAAADLSALAGRKSAALGLLGAVAADASAKGYALLAARARSLASVLP